LASRRTAEGGWQVEQRSLSATTGGGERGVRALDRTSYLVKRHGFVVADVTTEDKLRQLLGDDYETLREVT